MKQKFVSLLLELRRFPKSRRGAAAIMVGITLPILVGFMGLGVEVGLWYMYKHQLQSQVDMAAWAGAFAKKDGDTNANIILAATDEAKRNGWDTGTGTLAFTIPSPTRDESIEVVGTQDYNLLFISLFMSGPVTVAARAVAEWQEAGGGEGPCILALTTSDPAALEFSGEVTMDMECGIAVHSTSAQAMKISGTTFLDTTDVCVNGDIQISGSFSYTDGIDIANAPNLTNNGSAGLNCNVTEDPLENTAEPIHSDDCDYTDFKVDSDGDNSVTISPGVYCNGIDISGNNNDITFEPGEYILAGKGFKVAGSNNDVSGDGLFFYNTDNDGDGAFGDVDFSGSGNVMDFKGANPDDNSSQAGDASYVNSDYHGVLFFNDRSDPATDTYKKFKLAGEVTSDMDGIIYFPNWQVEYSGQSTNDHTCGAKIIADTVHFNGNSGNFFKSGTDCAASLLQYGPTTIRVRLVE
jgi:hypothetical protein